MNCVDTFKCIRLKKTFTVGRCVRNQKDALDFWGPDASKYQSCPCDQGIEIREQREGTMSAKGICKNCEREMAIMQEGMCGGCFNRAKGLKGEAREKALAQAKEDFKGKGPAGLGNRAPRKPKDISAPVSTRKPDRKADMVATHALPTLSNDARVSRICIDFYDGDHVLFDGLKALGRKYRRSPDQQLLWILEHELTSEGIIPGAQEVGHG